MKRARLVARKAAHHLTFGGAFLEGLARHGWSVEIAALPEPCELLVLWGTHNQLAIRQQLAWGGEVCILERGYMGDRYHWTSVSFGGGLNGRGRFYGPFGDPSRWEKHFAPLLKPWQPARGGYGLVLGQVVTDAAVKGVDIVAQWKGWIRQIEALGLRAVFRPHPLNRTWIGGLPSAVSGMRTLADDLASAAFTVSWNSNSGADAVLAGIPSVTFDEGAMAWDVTDHRISASPAMPDRLPWAHAMAWKQWTIDELSSGYCWEHVGPDVDSLHR